MDIQESNNRQAFVPLSNLVRDDRILPETRWLATVIIPPVIRLFIGVISVIGVMTLGISLLLFLQPFFMIRIWPWMLTPLTARVVGAIFALPGVLGLGIAHEPRWSAARLLLEAHACSIAMILIAAAFSWNNFDQSIPFTWFIVGG